MAGFYAVRVGRTPGVFTTWDACKASVDGHKGAVHKKFPTRAEAEAWISGGVRIEAATPSEVRELETLLRSTSNPMTALTHDETTTFLTQLLDVLVVYTDGSCTSNGQAGARAGVGVHWPCGTYPDQSYRLAGHPTNQRAELAAVYTALRQTAADPRTLEVRTDSKYVINILTDWMRGWKRNGWTTSSGGDVQNRDLIEALDDALQTRAGHVVYTHVRGHAGEPGNEAADALARAGGQKEIERKNHHSVA